MPKLISVDSTTPMRVVVVTLDNHLAATAKRAQAVLRNKCPGVELSLHAASAWKNSPDALERCKSDIASGDIIIATMLFMEEHIKPIYADLKARCEQCDAMVACMSAGEVVRLTRMGKFKMSEKEGGALEMLKRLRGSKKNGSSDGAKQMAMLKRLPKMLKFIPGSAQDLRAYFLSMQYWLACSDKNLANFVMFLADRYAAGPRKNLRGTLKPPAPISYPDTGIYHPAVAGRTTESTTDLPAPNKAKGTVGLVLMRAYVLAGDTGHYDAVIEALESRDLKVIPVYACGLDSRPAVERFFYDSGRPIVDAVLSLTGFSLVGGPAYNNADAAESTLANLDVPYLSAHALEFQTIEEWRSSDRGLMPVEATMMVAIPELDGAIGATVYGGRSAEASQAPVMTAEPERVDTLAGRVEKLIHLRKTPAADRKLAVTIFNFPPNTGAVGTAAHLDVFASLYNLLVRLKDQGYSVDVPSGIDEVREKILHGNAATYGADANVVAQISVDDHVRRETWLEEIEAQWGPAPGKHQTDSRSIFVLGAQFGNVLVGVQPGFGYEGDPMRLLFDKGFAPTHAFAAYYSFLKHDFVADAVLHFGTHGALEFMPGKQTGLSSSCWPDRLIGGLPNYYLYAANNPSEGLIAKRRSSATLISYLTPPLREAGLYKDLVELKETLGRWRSLPPEQETERQRLAELIQVQAAAIELVEPDPTWGNEAENEVSKVAVALIELEETLIPHGMHVVGNLPSDKERKNYLDAIRSTSEDDDANSEVLASADAALKKETELTAVLRALDGGFIRPVMGGDLLRNPEILPTGRNIHGFDPFRIPTSFAVKDGIVQADRLIERHVADSGKLPESVAMVLWGTDNLKTEGGPIGQALALIGAKPRHDSFGRLVGAELVDLETLGRPRIDVVMTLSGIFRDLLPLQMKMLAEAAYLAASADEPLDQNFVRRNALAHQAENDCDFETATLRVFSNADGAYGSNVNHLVDNGQWEDEDDLGDMFTQRKCFAYTANGTAVKHEELLKNMLGSVDLAYQNLESVEVGVTTIDHYFDSLGGITRAAARSRGSKVPVYIGDQTRNDGTVRSLSEQVALETRTRMLNPAWYEGMLKHGYEGVRQIEAHITNTVGWSATTGQVDPWVYRQLTETFVLDPEMRERLSDLNAQASVRVANRLLEAHERNYWEPDESTLEALRAAGDELEDKLEGVGGEIAA